ncbi:homoserine O-succinyltransferase [Parabacteroides sp. PF5-5]|uniref:homoserine O-acetyltransferase MetA n=1 Tax=unclassified Parabacteroides TaxID=2649774 RepID=UPI002476C221|nr:MULTISPECIES: homoserine O-succinyltransferase [unclassified Parabacteroides]MDH6305795.1 homoserine O-succinyltransferase [Parabacteroides sp. PH5-39]MDH6317768.1 homoserine O-succinyltransferase [Parabacteroides sp. PF5-13]MDH6320599.1 homoserine O-succinyltransferase [Parabacteroides sp. PH5-13]MDH6324238.1 homoserine O-succinyltransferase [Parabacteroides sp. PH5-8]MDH6328953.1 homoserine O-succinyltransferase [Parabacteroides sp. PH5-41]
MPLNLQKNLPAIDLLKKEHIFVMDSLRASAQDIRPLRVVVLNLMPLKITTETDLIRLLSNTPLQIEVEFMKIKGHTPKNTPIEHMQEFYKDFDEIADQYYDGLIVTGAPVEQMAFEEVNYWEEITGIFDWARRHVTSTLYICWAAQAALYHFYGVPKYALAAKKFGVFRHTLREPFLPIFRGFDEEFYVPHSRHTEIRREDILKVPELMLLSESEESGVYMAMSRGGREFYITGHSEYSPYTLNDEYIRDVDKGLPINVPTNYYRNNDPALGPVVRWRGHANLLFTNWLNYYVYQETPFRIEDIKNLNEL